MPAPTKALTVRQFFGRKGLLSEWHPNYEFRLRQRLYAGAIRGDVQWAAQPAKAPRIPGIDTFKGHTFHTSRWDYNYTGGDTTGNLHKLANKRVAIIGTSATAVQCVPYLAKDAQHLYVFQRTPSSVDERGNRPTDPEWVKTLTPGWQKRRMDNFNILV